MALGGLADAPSPDNETLLHLGRPARAWRPTHGSPPWQVEGAIRALHAAGRERLTVVYDGSGAAPAGPGEPRAKLAYLTEKYAIPSVALDAPHVETVPFVPRHPLLVLDRIYPDGIRIPKLFVGRLLVLLPTVRRDRAMAVAGALAGAMDGLLRERRLRGRIVLHEAMVDALQILRESRVGLFAVMDGSLVEPAEAFHPVYPDGRGLVAAGVDPVAVDAAGAALLGMDPMHVPFIRIADEKGLGVGRPDDIEVAGLGCSLREWTAANREIVPTSPRRLPGSAAPIPRWLTAGWNALLSDIGDPLAWHLGIRRGRVERAMETGWGRLYEGYGDGQAALPGLPPETMPVAVGAAALVATVGLAKDAKRRRRPA